MKDNFVFLVEDDEDLRGDLAFLLEHRGHRVETAIHGKDALQKLDELGRPCIILLDLMMPVMDGWELRAELLQIPSFSSVPVVLLSGIADIQHQAQSLQAIGYLTKPIDLQRLYTTIGQHCSP